MHIIPDIRQGLWKRGREGKILIKQFFSRILSAIIMSFVLSLISSQAAAGTFCADDFEYWDTPYNHGWETSDYTYPLFGVGIGYGNIRTVLDLQEGSRVFEAYYIPSIFNIFAPYTVANFNMIDPETGLPPDKKNFSVNVQSNFAIESFSMLQISLIIDTAQGRSIRLSYVPVDGDMPWISLSRPFDIYEGEGICFPIGRGVQDGGWHLILRDIVSDLEKAADIGLLSADDTFKYVRGILIQGNHFRLDDIVFHDDIKQFENNLPLIWPLGPQYATLFKPFELILYAQDPDGDPNYLDSDNRRYRILWSTDRHSSRTSSHRSQCASSGTSS